MSLRYMGYSDWVAWIFLFFAFARAILPNRMAVANRLHVAFLRFVCSRYICIHWEQHGIRRMGTIRRSAESARGAFFLFFLFSMKDLHGVVGVLVFLFVSFLFNIVRATSTLMQILISVLVIYTYRYTRHIWGPSIYPCWAPMYAMGFLLAFFFRSSSIFLYLITRENRLGGVS